MARETDASDGCSRAAPSPPTAKIARFVHDGMCRKSDTASPITAGNDLGSDVGSKDGADVDGVTDGCDVCEGIVCAAALVDIVNMAAAQQIAASWPGIRGCRRCVIRFSRNDLASTGRRQ